MTESYILLKKIQEKCGASGTVGKAVRISETLLFSISMLCIYHFALINTSWRMNWYKIAEKSCYLFVGISCIAKVMIAAGAGIYYLGS